MTGAELRSKAVSGKIVQQNCPLIQLISLITSDIIELVSLK